jgi:putative ABC transport system permease protein
MSPFDDEQGGTWWIPPLLRLYPRDYRHRHGAELARAMRACYQREILAGATAAATILRIALDAVTTSFLVRRDAFRTEHRAPRTPHRAPGTQHLAPRTEHPARSTSHPAPRTEHPAPSTGDPVMQSILYDVRHAVRMLRRAPLFSALVVATLALAIGANTAIFSVVNGVLLRSLPYAEPGRLVLLYEGIASRREPFGFSAPDLVGFQERARSYDGLAAFRNVEFELSGVDQPERITAARISASLMDVLGTRPALGRAFTPEEDKGRQPVAILTDGLWRRKFGADASAIGKPILLDRRAYTIVGVMRPSFTFPNRGPQINNVPADVYVPLSFSDFELRAFGGMYNNSVAGRLKPGVTVQQAGAEAADIAKRIVAELYPAPLRESGFSVTSTAVPMRDDVVGNFSRILYVLLAAVGVVLLIACADIACLILTRAAAREREMAIRAALGAGRWRVMRLVLIETSVLAVTGGAAGLALAWWGQRALLAAAPVSIPRAQDIPFDARVLGFTIAASVAAALVCGALPALESSRRESGTALKEGGRTAASGVRQRRIFAGLVTVQFALAVVLLAAGGLLIRSFVRLMATDPGFRTDHVISAATSLPASSYPDGASVRSFYGRLLERVRRLPGVTAAGAATDLPLSVRERRAFTIENPQPSTTALSHTIANDWIMGGYFDAIGVRVVRGRSLSDVDTAQSEPVVVVNETLARRYWPGEDPVGRRLAWGGAKTHGAWMRVVGVIGDIKQAGLAAPTEPATWQPWAQVPDPVIGNNPTGIFRSLRLMVRSGVPPSSLMPAIRQEVRALDPALPVTGVLTLDEVVGASGAAQRFNAVLLGGFAGVALLLAAVGIGGVLAISVSRRTQEIGIRLALGARAGDVVWMVVRQGMTLVLAGLVIGLPSALAATRLLRSLLFETAPHDAVSFAAATVILCAVALVACAAPALRASRVSPITALRID